MSIVRVTKKFNFEMAHALACHDGKCRNIHGHSYVLYVCIQGQPIENEGDPKNGMVIDFTDLKTIVNREIITPIDHSLMLYEKSEFLSSAKSLHQLLVLKPYNPTCENMVIDFASIIMQNLPSGIKLHSLKLEETKTSYAEWFAKDNN
ncbi:MAG: 6-carboxytetrahydropterin synthase [Cyclobacteriaceae bacterium]|nr:6-carboxytetrahydropterin synthase [Cyclobacteriaceae bacterium]